ncbi:peroxisomal membrane protein 2-like [Oscarella lobularis]|uniref:peroxisomal membrane protein 2-like n=1 Tax=Oscarella lobularis TaxID=121494 RepID=UPI0033141728
MSDSENDLEESERARAAHSTSEHSRRSTRSQTGSPFALLKAKFANVLRWYTYNLKKKPVLTKAITSATLSALGETLVQKYGGKGDSAVPAWRSVLAYAMFGFVVTGPLIHHYHRLLEKFIPPKSEHAMIKKLLVDRFVFTPPLLALFFYVIALLEGRGTTESKRILSEHLWPTLKLSWKIYTVVQFVNLYYVPQQFRVLFTNLLGFLWTVYISLISK